MSDTGINLGGAAATKNPYTKKFENIKIENANKSSKIQKIDRDNLKPTKIGSFKDSLDAANLKHGSSIDNSGTDFALKKLSKRLEDDIMGILYNLMFDSVNMKPQGGVGEDLFRRDYVPSLLSHDNDSGSGEVRLGQIGEGIYNELKGDKNKVGID